MAPIVGTERWISTVLINVLGCAAIGAAAGYAHRAELPGWAAPLLMTGVLGGFTTFSAFGLEVTQLIEAKRWNTAFACALGSLLLGVGAAWLASAVVRK